MKETTFYAVMKKPPLEEEGDHQAHSAKMVEE